ncbi:hypothetical protein L873DRAFT_1846478 [Choiromyces venosus 120613-1]|uniref:Uncharacterized protein n=1 Tax=Choiromyces venosus 120613-1 TaxID=1336337 RepID=A0A3N4JLH5_9PEZI|nr:hypothetical protein L873DRAFT_1846478 [Choiromyces venosus 120613-1]
MASPYAFHNNPAAYARYNPALYPGGLGGSPTVGPANTPTTPAGYGPRRSSVSPMRTPTESGEASGEYNPQHYGPVAANGGGSFVPRPAGEDAPPPPYSPPSAQRHPSNPRLQLNPPHQRQHSWPYNSQNTTPISPQQVTPSTATSQNFSPIFSQQNSAASTANTTPLSPYAPLLQEQLGWNGPTRRRNYSPPGVAGGQGYAPSGLQQTSYPSPDIPPPSSPIVDNVGPSSRAGSRRPTLHNVVPPPPPGPPPAQNNYMRDGSPMAAQGRRTHSSCSPAMPAGLGIGMRSGSRSPPAMSLPPGVVRADSLSRIPPPPPGPPPRSESVPRNVYAPGSVRNDSQNRGAIPPPPPGPPPRNPSLPRVMNQGRSVSSPVMNPAVMRMQSRSPPQQPSRLSTESNGSNSYQAAQSGTSSGSRSAAITSPPPAPPPKRKMEGEEMPHKKSSPGPRSGVEEGLGIAWDQGRPDPDNNPWRQATASPVMNSAEEMLSPRDRGLSFSAARGQSAAASLLIDYEEGEFSPPPEATPKPSFSAAASPPFSPDNNRVRRKPIHITSPPVNNYEPPKQLPTPPPGVERDSKFRPVSHLLHLPNAGGQLQPPLIEEEEEEMDAFYLSAMERHRKMIRLETTASTDEERVGLWLDYVLKECELRKERYSRVVGKMRSSLTAKLGSAFLEETQQNLTPISPVMKGMDGEDVEMENTQESRRRPETQWWGQYLNSNSFDNGNPTDVALEARIRDEESSRGRTSSRWWEASAEGGSVSDHLAVRSDGMGDDEFGMARSGHRYARTPRASLREIAEHVTTPRSSQLPGDPVSYAGSSTYPPDRKTMSMSRSRSRPAHSQSRTRAPVRPVKTSLDIAPLLTLLPPYPRVYPAVNNAHPQLAVFRNLVRTLNDLSSITAIKADFSAASSTRKETFTIESLKRRNQHSEYIQSLYSTPAGNKTQKRLSFDQLETLNTDFQNRENVLTEESLKSEFDLFQAQVVDAVHAELRERISAASAAYSDLAAEIIANVDNPLGGQEEGGDQVPELLEKLTCLKWVFDVREQLHREVFDLVSERNRRYKEVIITPFFASRLADKIREAEDFFTADENARRINADKESLSRYEGFLDLVENHVVKGVEKQISAFWEVAPLIMECFEKIPTDLTNVHPIVPPEEYHENPAYLREPLRYLHSKIEMAEKSIYQFVEGQTNLLCLLHEVKTLSVAAGWKVRLPGLENARIQEERREKEEAVLTEDLKEKVKMLESEWQESLGGVFEEVRGRVGRWIGEVETAE